jgi:hypothetical protein
VRLKSRASEVSAWLLLNPAQLALTELALASLTQLIFEALIGFTHAVVFRKASEDLLLLLEPCLCPLILFSVVVPLLLDFIKL